MRRGVSAISRSLVGTAVLAALLGSPASAAAAPTTELMSVRNVAPGVERYSYRYGPLDATPGTNLQLIGPVTIEKPAGDGFQVRFKPDLVDETGKPPRVDEVHMHHAVVLNLSRTDTTAPGIYGERVGGFGEEKTIGTLPSGYGYPIRATDQFALVYMLHNGTPNNRVVWVTYEIDWIPRDSALGKRTKPARPLWLDVQNGKYYPVFDVARGDGGDGKLTVPDEVSPSPYGSGVRRNEWTADRDMTLVATAGHVHPGGLWTDLSVVRGNRAQRVFRSRANYYDPNGPVSWDLSMDHSPPDWRVGVRKGEKLRISTTYDSARAATYEDMGIMLVFAADGYGPDPFANPPSTKGAPTHGQMPEATNYGGEATGRPDPRKLPDGGTVQNGVGIAGFTYLPGDQAGPFPQPPVIGPGQQLRFGNFDAAASIWHTVTACRAPCNRTTGVSYPLADGEIQFDSGQLGYGPEGITPTAQRADWYTPKNLPGGTYTYFCRVHPYMRGSFRVKGTPPPPPAFSVAAKRIRLPRSGELRIPLGCRGGPQGCGGKLTVTAPKRGGGTTELGRDAYYVKPGGRSEVILTLTRAWRTRVKKSGRLPILVTATPEDGGRPVKATVTLLPPRR